ncbi:MAG TPA: S41 family peptidase [Candidatus Cloacimonadota bacterium]|nr:S41 family peptidase [Candidatus Cloacimonadota bacterium]
MRKTFFVVLLALIGMATLSANQPMFPKDPSISPDGNDVCFEYDGDLWIVPFWGGSARRLTSTATPEWGPQWSPDGKMIAFNSNREGVVYPYVMPVAGGSATPIIKESYTVVEWFSDARSLLAARYNPRFGTSFYRLPLDGTRPTLLAEIGDRFATLSPDNKSIVFNRYGDAYRESYRGSLAGELWKIDLATKEYSRLTNTDHTERYPRFAASSGALFYCESDGNRYQLTRVENLDFSRAERISNLSQWSARDISVARTSERVVFEHFNELWKYDPQRQHSAQVMKLDIRIPEDQWLDTRRVDSMRNDVWQFCVSDDEKLLGLQYKFDAFLKPREGGDARRVTFDQAGISGMEFLEDKRTLVLQKLDHGRQKLFTVNASEPTILKELDWFGRDSLNVESFYRDLSGKWVIYYTGPTMSGQVAIADSGLVNFRPLNASGPVTSRVGINSDASWAAYTCTRADYIRELYVYEFATGTHTKLLNDDSWTSDIIWTNDNRSLILSRGGNISRLDLMPRDEFELEKDYWADVFAPISTETDSGDIEDEKQSDALSTENSDELAPVEEPELEETEPQSPDVNETIPEAEPKPPTKIEIWWPELEKRVYPIVTDSEAQLTPYRVKTDSTFYYLSNGGYYGKPTILKSVNLYGKNIKDELNFGMSPWGFVEKNGNFYYVLDGMLRTQWPGGNRKDIRIDLEYEWDLKTLNTRVFEEAWGVFGDNFYDPNMHGKDWQAMYKLYLPYAEKAQNIDQIGTIVDEMIGDLNASHTGFYPRTEQVSVSRSVASLGLEFDQAAVLERGLRISLVYPGTRLSQFFKLQTGDLLTSIDGVVINSHTSIDSLLLDKIGKRVFLELERAGEIIKADIKGLSFSELRRLEYNYRIDQRRALVKQLTDNQVGYIHIPAMGQRDYENFTRELYRDNLDKKALIIDVRGNVGGRIHDQLLTLLMKKQYATSTSRRLRYQHSPEPFRVWDRPSIVLVDERSFSDGEIFPIIYKELKLGKVVGIPSSGAVIGTWEYELIDGSSMRLPGSGWYKMDGTNMEGTGAMPDIIVENTPNDVISDRDPQLLRAIEEIILELK